MKIKRKKILRWLKAEAKKLPEETYFAIDLYYKPKWSDEDGEWKRGMVSEHKVNHYRRMKRLYDRWGLPAINGYMYVKGQFLLQNKNQDNEKDNIS